MAMLVWVVSAIAGVYGLGWLIFAFVNPPGLIRHWYQAPSMLFFLSERGGRIAIGVLCVALSVFASTVVPLLWR